MAILGGGCAIWNKEVPSGIKHFQETTFLSAYKDHFLQQYKAFTVQSQTVILAITDLSPQGTFLRLIPFTN